MSRLSIKLTRVSEDQKYILARLLELYEYDFSEYSDSDLNRDGCYGYEYLDLYWKEADRCAFFIEVNDNLAGFVMVSNFSFFNKKEKSNYISEFFVLRKYRRTRVGTYAAIWIFDNCPGRWEVAQHEMNHPALMFWEAVIEKYTNGVYDRKAVSTEDWDGRALIFDNSH